MEMATRHYLCSQAPPCTSILPMATVPPALQHCAVSPPDTAQSGDGNGGCIHIFTGEGLWQVEKWAQFCPLPYAHRICIYLPPPPSVSGTNLHAGLRQVSHYGPRGPSWPWPQVLRSTRYWTCLLSSSASTGQVSSICQAGQGLRAWARVEQGHTMAS
jgi:hypothetical protein